MMDIVSWAFGQPTYDLDKPIFIDASDTSQTISASQARLLVQQLIAGFKASGLRRGDTVCILTLSNVAGGNPGHTVYELQHLLSKCSVRYIITESRQLAKVQGASKKCGIDSSKIFVSDNYDRSIEAIRSWRTLLNHGESDWEALNELQSGSTVAAYYSTSGTTGSPKFAAISHAYQVANGSYIEAETKSKPYQISRLVSLPLMHAFAAPLVHLAALRCGTPTFIMSRFSAADFVSTVSQHSLTEFPVVPSMLMSLIASPACTPAALKSVREVMCAGAPLSTHLAASFSAVLTAPSARLIQLYGATEAGWISSTPYSEPNNYPHSAAATTGKALSPQSDTQASAFPLHAVPTPTVGIPLPSHDLRLVNSSSGAPISGNMISGSLQIHTPHPFMYYLGAEQATRDSFTADGWLKTGDIAICDDAGRYYIVDREKDMIKVRGWQVAPAEIEAALATHPVVHDCAVLGVEDTKGCSGEVPWAFVALKTGRVDTNSAEPINEKLFKAWLRERLAGYKVPETILIVEQIPRNPAGKILRRLLREKYMPVYSPSTPAAVPDIGTVLPTPVAEKSLNDIVPPWTVREEEGSETCRDHKVWPQLVEQRSRCRQDELFNALEGYFGKDASLFCSPSLLVSISVTVSVGFWVCRTNLMAQVRHWLFQ